MILNLMPLFFTDLTTLLAMATVCLPLASLEMFTAKLQKGRRMVSKKLAKHEHKVILQEELVRWQIPLLSKKTR